MPCHSPVEQSACINLLKTLICIYLGSRHLICEIIFWIFIMQHDLVVFAMASTSFYCCFSQFVMFDALLKFRF